MRLLIALLSLAVGAAAESPFAGTWEGKINCLPGIELSVEESGGSDAVRLRGLTCGVAASERSSPQDATF